MQIMTINEFANRCGYFFNAGTDPEALSAPNNGYNCKHPEQTEKQNGVGCCFQWSCPLAISADEEDCEKYGIEYEEDEFVLVEDESGMPLPTPPNMSEITTGEEWSEE